MWYQENKLRLRKRSREYQRRWRAENPGYSGRKTPQAYNSVVQRKAKAKYLSKPGNREHARAKSREYYRANRERILEQKRRRAFERALAGRE